MPEGIEFGEFLQRLEEKEANQMDGISCLQLFTVSKPIIICSPSQNVFSPTACKKTNDDRTSLVFEVTRSGLANGSGLFKTVWGNVMVSTDADHQGPDFDDVSSFFPCEIEDAIQYGYGAHAPKVGTL